MKKNLFKPVAYAMIIASVTFASCKKDNPGTDPGADDGTRWITVTGAYPDESGTAGNGGTRAYAISPENAADPNYVIDLFKQDGSKYVVGFGLKSERTARVQASADGKYLYNIQYTGTEGGVFNKYSVSGEGQYEEVGYELNTAVILGTSPRWVKAAEGIGVGVSFGDARDSYTGTAPDYVYQHPKGKIRIANIDLNSTAITNTGSIDIELDEDLEEQGYHIWRADVPILNQAKNKLFIGVGVRKHDLEADGPVAGRGGALSWPTTSAYERDLGTVTYVVDYPSLRNPKMIESTKAVTDNLSYRTMTQYVGDDGHVYQAATSMGSGHQILRISKSTNEYDNNYDFNLNTALGIDDAGIRAWRYIEDGVGVVLYTRTSTAGGYVALINLNDKTATKLNIENEADAGFSGLTADQNGGVELTGTFGQFQNIGVVGDYVYVPMSPNGKDGNLYVIDWKNETVKKGAKLKNASGSFYLGAY
ncbi:DUF4374 domain-containing protein [Sphingobacterium sp. SGG-5]|uniref:DUF4374 domain-containing protein n=1 Tax=Sphingobacterium sp. SGG-5 TaxID=2710881 RepID=UPI0013EAD176|nr:DUF4374 domain-containing protein [Sphingobacterium sp. SGG-5]NGM60876.1 DUF4374 domain-containing protein [Sphingobacterium sp. SGG-5]